MLKTTKSLAIAGLIILVTAGNALAERVQPYILASSGQGDFAKTVTATWDKLTEAGFKVEELTNHTLVQKSSLSPVNN